MCVCGGGGGGWGGGGGGGGGQKEILGREGLGNTLKGLLLKNSFHED